MKYRCPCCGYYTLSVRPKGYYDICPVCFWENDPVQLGRPDYAGGANGVSLNQARANYRQFGAVTADALRYVRKPRVDELAGIK